MGRGLFIVPGNVAKEDGYIERADARHYHFPDL
jgi:hypothetical protein